MPTTASKEIDEIIKNAEGWKGKKLSEIRAAIKKADPEIIEEVKWKKPSAPEGVPVWGHEGIICVGNILKNSVRITFAKGGQFKDEKLKKMFNASLKGNFMRGIDYFEKDKIDETAIKDLVKAAIKYNEEKKK